MLEILVLCFGVLLSCYYYWSRRHIYECAKRFSGPKCYPIIGNGLDFLCKEEEIFNTVTKITRAHPSPVRIWAGPKLVLFITDASQLQQIVHSSKMTTKAFLYRFLEPFLGKGLFTSTGEKHKNDRRLFQPMFSQKHIVGYSNSFQKHALKLVNNLQEQVDKEEFDILPYLNATGFEALMDILMEDRNEHSIDYKDIPHFIKEFYKIFFKRSIRFWLHFDPIYKLTEEYRKQQRMKTIMTVMARELKNERLPEITAKWERQMSGAIDTTSQTVSVLEMLMEMLRDDPNAISEQDCIDHLMTFVAAGEDTQNSAVGFTCMMFGMFPEIQEKAYEELKLAVGENNVCHFDDLPKLVYLEMCIKESLRLFSVAPFIFREAIDDFPLDKDRIIPKGAVVGLALHSVHTDPKYWEKSLEYFPEHFTEERVKMRHSYAFLPFSGGSRGCIAQQYSYTNMKIVLSSLLLNYVFVSSRKFEDLKLTSDVSIRPIGGYLVRIRKRASN